MLQRIIAVLSLLAVGSVLAKAAAVALPGPLVSTDWLAAHRTEVNVLDVRDVPDVFTRAPVFSETDGKKNLETLGGHIPGALLLDFAKARVTRNFDGRDWDFMLPDAATFQTLMREVGVDKDRPTVIVSDGATVSDLDMAARVFWSMKVYGDERLAILDGGMSAWLRAGQPFATDAAKSGGGTWVAGPLRTKLFADSTTVAKAIAEGKQLLDARPAPAYYGLERKPIVLASGHIAGALDFPSDLRASMREGSLRFLNPAEYQALFKHLGIDPKKPSITYCNTGHMASGAWFVLSELMGNPQVGLYDGSLYQWTHEERPLVGLR